MESAVCPSVPTGTRLIETFGYHPDQGVARLDLHLARLTRSARALGFGFDPEMLHAQVAEINSATALRCRMTLVQDGTLALEVAPMVAASLTPWIFRIAPERLASGDLLLRHKTTQRALYDNWRAKLPDGVQEWVFLNERGEICEGTITNIAITTSSGARLTPALASGCLPGVFRQSLLDQGLLREAVLTPNDLADAVQISLMNSLRGEMTARWDAGCVQRAVLL